MSNYDDFFNLPMEVQRGFVNQFRIVSDSAIFCGDHYNVFGDTMTIEQFNTISEIVKKFDNEKR